MPPYAVVCYSPGCGQPAAFKVAARWSDGLTAELKSYGLCCAACLPGWFDRARVRHAACSLAPGESLDPPGIYRFDRSLRDRQLERLPELERQFTHPPADTSS
jgi:hypothetical protein